MKSVDNKVVMQTCVDVWLYMYRQPSFTCNAISSATKCSRGCETDVQFSCGSSSSCHTERQV